MAKTSDRVMELLHRVWKPAKVACNHEKQLLEEFIKEKMSVLREETLALEPWDWRYYAEKYRLEKYAFDSSELKPYFSLTQITQALFHCAKQLFNIDFILIDPTSLSTCCYHSDVLIYEVRQYNSMTQESELIALFLHDNFSRPNKQSGAWMSEYRVQTKNYNLTTTSTEIIRVCDKNSNTTTTSIIPIIVNNNNFCKAPDGQDTLLSPDDARTLFHEFGHGLHGMLSNVTYTTLAGTSVLKDFVELPSQIFEHWIRSPEILQKYARHYQTQEPIPQELIQKLEKVQNYNNGFDTVEYVASALFDQYLHQLVFTSTHSTSADEEGNPALVVDGFDLNQIENDYLKSIEMPQGMILRHRPTHFLHLFSGPAYAAGYYVYLWAEVLDADGFDAFVEAGDIFDQETAHRLKKFIYSTGNSLEPGEAYRLFRGRDPTVIPMLKKKGLWQEE
jgi:peptidyl-dipeptidase Dcp